MPLFQRKKGKKKPPMQDRMKLIMTDLAGARTWLERLVIIETNRELLLNIGAEIALVSHIAMEQDPARVEVLRELRSALVSSRKNGVAQTFRELLPHERLTADEEEWAVTRIRMALEDVDSPGEAKKFVETLRLAGVPYQLIQRVTEPHGM